MFHIHVCPKKEVIKDSAALCALTSTWCLSLFPDAGINEETKELGKQVFPTFLCSYFHI